MVDLTFWSSPGRKPTIGIMSAEASRSSDPNDCVNAPALSLQPCSRMAPRISSLTLLQPSTFAEAPSWGGQLDGTVERCPAHQLRVEEVPGITADLPDALIAL